VQHYLAALRGDAGKRSLGERNLFGPLNVKNHRRGIAGGFWRFIKKLECLSSRLSKVPTNDFADTQSILLYKISLVNNLSVNTANPKARNQPRLLAR
jgi:hypothetical protein